MKEIDLSEFCDLFPDEAPRPIQKMNPTIGIRPLHNPAKPQCIRQRERPSHRAMIEMSAQGFTGVEIARRLEMSPVTVNDVLKQHYAQEQLPGLIHAVHGTDHEVVEVIKQNIVAAVETLAEIMHDKKARASDRISAAESFLNRRYGKPNQPINRGTDVDLNTLSDAELASMLPSTDKTGTTK